MSPELIRHSPSDVLQFSDFFPPSFQEDAIFEIAGMTGIPEHLFHPPIDVLPPSGDDAA